MRQLKNPAKRKLSLVRNFKNLKLTTKRTFHLLKNIAEAELQNFERVVKISGYPGRMTRVKFLRYERISFVSAGARVRKK